MSCSGIRTITCPAPIADTDPRVDILDADLTGLPDATIILAECDPIRPQGERYIAALEAAGVPIRSHLTPGMVHGFFGLDEVFPSATEAMTFAGQRLARSPRCGGPMNGTVLVTGAGGGIGLATVSGLRRRMVSTVVASDVKDTVPELPARRRRYVPFDLLDGDPANADGDVRGHRP